METKEHLFPVNICEVYQSEMNFEKQQIAVLV